jgi:ribosomal protein L19E
LNKLIKDKNIIKKPKRTLGSLRADFTLANVKEIRRSKNGTKKDPNPKYLTK